MGGGYGGQWTQNSNVQGTGDTKLKQGRDTIPYVCIYLKPPETRAYLRRRAEKRYRPQFRPTLQTIIEVPVSLLSVGYHMYVCI